MAKSDFIYPAIMAINVDERGFRDGICIAKVVAAANDEKPVKPVTDDVSLNLTDASNHCANSVREIIVTECLQ